MKLADYEEEEGRSRGRLRSLGEKKKERKEDASPRG